MPEDASVPPGNTPQPAVAWLTGNLDGIHVSLVQTGEVTVERTLTVEDARRLLQDLTDVIDLIDTDL